ncbi:hypothetical protein YH62_10255 [Rhizobium sp. LC145]|nr:hypothetical protein YH62_10255 [Rhizobium sp. LC145]
MPFDFHGIMEHASHTDQTRVSDAIKQEMPRAADHTAFITRPITAMAKMIAADIFAQLRTESASRPLWLYGDVVQRHHQQSLVT